MSMKSVLSDVNVNDRTVAFTCLQTAMIFTPNSPFPKGTQLLSLFHLRPPFLGRCNPLVPSNKTRITYPHVGRVVRDWVLIMELDAPDPNTRGNHDPGSESGG